MRSACVAALALPAAALAHPAVYKSQQLVLEGTDACRIADNPLNDSCIQDDPRITYAVGNDGYAMAFTEGNPATAPANTTPTNGAPANRGMVNYRFLPGTWRGAAAQRPLYLTYGPAQTDLQPHATCMGGTIDTPANVLAWQGDPFYNYIPWQKTAVGIGDDPARWIAVVKDKTGVDLSTLNTAAEFEAACEAPAIGGTYYAADSASNITSVQVSNAVTAATAPLNAQIATLQGQISPLQSQVDQLQNQVTTLEAARPPPRPRRRRPTRWPPLAGPRPRACRPRSRPPRRPRLTRRPVARRSSTARSS